MRRLLGSIRLWPAMVVVTTVIGVALAVNGAWEALILPAWIALYGVYRRARNADGPRKQYRVEKDPEVLKQTAQLRSVRRQAF
ncbi:MAG TPA: hypothetical protein VK906_08180 [Egicoccus sp.]|nr:hypothetical protein [Egicoccus sp.]HSK23137.1 hypothetical protein [Egicoccus sp.]